MTIQSIGIVALALFATAHVSRGAELRVSNVLENSAALNGKIVQVRGYIQSGFETFAIADTPTGQGLWIQYPERVSPGPGYRVSKDREFWKMIKGLPEWRGHGGCRTVQAILTGRIDAVETAGLIRDSSGKIVEVKGFGHLNLYRVQLVLQKVSAVMIEKKSCE